MQLLSHPRVAAQVKVLQSTEEIIVPRCQAKSLEWEGPPESTTPEAPGQVHPWPAGSQFFPRRKAGPSSSTASSASAVESTTQHVFSNQKRTHCFSPCSYPRWPLTLRECGIEKQLLSAGGLRRALSWQTQPDLFSGSCAACVCRLGLRPSCTCSDFPLTFSSHPAGRGPGGLLIKLQKDTLWALLVPLLTFWSVPLPASPVNLNAVSLLPMLF